MAAHLGIALNLKRRAASQFTNWDFNSLCYFNGKWFGADDSGVFQVNTGTDDDGTAIQSRVRVATDFGAQREKRLRRLAVDGEFSGKMSVLVENDQENSREYTLYPKDTDNNQHVEARSIGRDGRGSLFNVEIRNYTTTGETFSGSDFSLDGCDAFVVLLPEGRRGR